MPKEQTEEKVLFKYEGMDVYEEYNMPDYFYSTLKKEVFEIAKEFKIDFTFKKFNNENPKDFMEYCTEKIPSKYNEIMGIFLIDLSRYLWGLWKKDNLPLSKSDTNFTFSLKKKKIYRIKSESE